MVNILAIDPGTYESAWAVVGDGNMVTQFGKRGNEEVLEALALNLHGWHTVDLVVIEMMSSCGKRGLRDAGVDREVLGGYREAPRRHPHYTAGGQELHLPGTPEEERLSGASLPHREVRNRRYGRHWHEEEARSTLRSDRRRVGGSRGGGCLQRTPPY